MLGKRHINYLKHERCMNEKLLKWEKTEFHSIILGVKISLDIGWENYPVNHLLFHLKSHPPKSDY